MYDFVKDFMPVEGEKPLDRLVSDGGTVSLLRTVCCIGDSLASGEFESTGSEGKTGYNDMFEFSWGQYLARMAGIEVRNFSRGGMTAKEYMESFADKKGLWADDKLCRAYIIALGVNDVVNRGQAVGSVEDLDREEETDTFAWYYGRLIKRLRQIVPKCRLFLMTIPKRNNKHDYIRDAHAKLLHDIAEKLEFCYVIDLFNDGEIYDETFYKRFFMGGHMNAAGYLYTARIVASYVDYIIRHNWEDFVQIPFVTTPMHNEKYKW